jgi:hypothetical protein
MSLNVLSVDTEALLYYVKLVFDIAVLKNVSSSKFSKEQGKDKLNCCVLNVDPTRSGDESEITETKLMVNSQANLSSKFMKL